MSRAVNLVVSCTSRKRFDVSPETVLGGIGGASVAERLQRWGKSLRRAAIAEHRADDLYMGDHWYVVRSIPAAAEQSGLDVHTWICSAGYGLIKPATLIKPYRATFTRGEKDYVALGFPDEASSLDRWWRGVCSLKFSQQSGGPRTIGELAATFPRTPMVVALSADYLKAVTPDMQTILSRPYFREHLAIISCGTRRDQSPWKENLLPCDASLAGALGGVLTSLNARVARRVLQRFDEEELTVQTLTAAVASIGRTTPSSAITRVPRSDSEVAGFIRNQIARVSSCSKTVLLREFRRQGQACEQKRFGEIYLKVRQEVDLDA